MINPLQQFKEKLELFDKLSDETWEAFRSKLVEIRLPKNVHLINFNEVEKHVYFIAEGMIRFYAKNRTKEYSTDFSFENQFAGSITSFVLQQPSKYALCTLCNSTILKLSKEDLDHIYCKYPQANYFGRKMAEVLLIDKWERQFEYLTLNAEERYRKLLRENPKYVKDIPLKHLASYLGITPESLSRIRAKI